MMQHKAKSRADAWSIAKKSFHCTRCDDWEARGLSSTCPNCDELIIQRYEELCHELNLH